MTAKTTATTTTATSTTPPPSGGSAELDVRILEELIFERVKVTVDLYELLALRDDLSVSVRRALRLCARAPEEQSELSRRFLERAWRRVGDEVLRELREVDLEDAIAAGRPPSAWPSVEAGAPA